MSSRILHVFRAAGEFRSIEGLFGAVRRALPGDFEVQSTFAPRPGAKPGSLFANLLWAGRLDGADVLHLTGDIHYAVLAMRRSPVVLTIHDLRFIEEARGFKRAVFWWLWLYLPCLRADRITVISEFTRDRLLAICPVRREKLHVVPNCIGPEFVAVDRPWPATPPRLLHLGTTPNKNLSRLIEACAGLPLQLVIVGKLSPSQQEELKHHGLACEQHQDLSPQEIATLYAGADLVSFISTYEGFGLPILEAQAVGRPVITSDLSPMREVAGGGALLVDPHSPASIRAGLVRLMGDSHLREKLIATGFLNVANYSATSVARQYAGIYRLAEERKVHKLN